MTNGFSKVDDRKEREELTNDTGLGRENTRQSNSLFSDASRARLLFTFRLFLPPRNSPPYLSTPLGHSEASLMSLN